MKVFKVIIMACFLLLPQLSSAIAESEFKAVLYYKFAMQTQWPNEASLSHITLGFYPPQPAAQNFLKKNLIGKKIHNLPIKIVGYDSLAQAKKAQLLVVSPSKNAQLREITNALVGTHTLLITESSQQTLSTMINLVRLPDNKISFEIHRPNIVYEGLQVDRDVILLGGSELDVAKLYKETEIELAKTKRELTRQVTEVTQQKVLLASQQKSITQTKLDLSRLQERLKDHSKKLDVSALQLEKDKALLQQNQSLLKQQSLDMAKQESIFLEKVADLSEKQRLIDSNIEFLAQQKSIIAKQEEQIVAHKQILNAKVDQIQQQESVITSQSEELVKTTEDMEQLEKVLTYQYIATVSLSLVVFIALCAAFVYIRTSRRLTRSNQKLSQMALELQETSEAKSMFLSTMSHEIRTPMNGVIGMADLLASSDLNSEQLRQLRVIQSSGKVLVNVINDILDFSKIEAGKMDIEEVAFSPDSVVSDACAMLVPLCREKQLELSVLVEPDVPDNLLGDPARISQIVTNFMSNAIKFTEAGTIRVSVRLHENCWRIEVSDSGCGMTEEQTGRVFDAFSQAEKSTNRQYGGTGLGLTISKKLVELMNGSIGLKSKLGSGTTIWLDLPIDDATTEAPINPTKQSLSASKILLSVENTELQALLLRYFEKWGMSVTDCADGASLVAQLSALNQVKQAEQPTVIVSDSTLDFSDAEVQTQLQAVHCVCLSLKLQLDAMSKIDCIDTVLESPITASRLYNCLSDIYGLESSADHPEVVEQLSFEGARVLVAEDNKVNQMVVKGLLAKRGITPVVVNDGQEALDQLASEYFDLVLMDCEMPRVDGYEATQIHRMREQGRHTPIVALTAHAMTEHRAKAEACGMDGHLAKPINQTILDEFLSRYCSK